MSSFSVLKLEAALETSLPVDGNGTSVIKGTRRETPYGTLFNVSVHSVDKKGFVTTRYGIPDDDTYLQYPSLFAVIPRILVVRVNDDETGSYAVVASGQPKFMAVTNTDNDDGDDDDDDDDDDADAENNCGAFRIPGVVSYYADEKANGHLIFYRLIPGTRLLLAGTKNYAWLASLDDSLQTIEASSPTAMTVDAYAYMFDMLKRDCMYGNVMRVLQTGVTLLGERETNQHLRYYADPGVMFFDASLPPPFKTPHSVGPFAVKDMTNEKLLQLRSGGNSEGWVLRGVNAHGETLVRLKLKTAWYVILRGGRQLFNPTDGLDVTLTKWRARMHVQNAFLHIDASYLDTVVFDGYIVPLATYMYARGVKKTDICYSGLGFAPVLEAFRRETGINDDFTNLPTMSNITRVSHYGKSGGKGGGGGGTLIMTACMPPGVGKTTLMMDLAARFGGTHLSQDQFATNRGAFYACLKTRLKAHDAVFLHRCCFNRKDRASVFTIVRETKSRVFLLEAENDAALLYTALRGVVLRGENHETMGKLSDAKRCFITANFYTKHERVDVATECRGIQTAIVHNFNMLRYVDLPLHVHDALKGLLDVVCSRDAFNTDDTTLTDVESTAIVTLVENIKAGPELRHSSSTLASNAELLCKSFLCSDFGVSVASVSSARVRFIAILLTPESKAKLTRMLSEHIALPVENVIHTGDHVTVSYQPSSSVMTLLTPHFNTTDLSLVTKYIKRHKSGGIAATRVLLCDDVHADIRAVMSPQRMAHVTAFYNPATYKAVDANRLFIDDDWVTETESFALTITLQGTLTCVHE